MIENATTHATAMNLIIQSVGTVIMGIINWLKAFFSAPYAGSFLVAILILATIIVGCWTKRMHKRSDFYNRFQQVYDKLLIPGEVKLCYGITNKLNYTQENHQEWNGFIDVVNKEIKRKWWKYFAWGLYKKTEKKFEDFEKFSKSFRFETISFFQNMIEKNNCEFLIWDGNGELPLEDYIEKKQIPKIFEHVIEGINIETYKSGSGGYAFRPPNKMGNSKSENKMKKLGGLIQSAIDDNEEIKKLLTKRKTEKIKAEKLLKDYNNKLVKVIHDLRFCRW